MKAYVKRVEKSEILRKIIEIHDKFLEKKRIENENWENEKIVVKLRKYLTKYIYIYKENRETGSVDKYNWKNVLKNWEWK